jgi:hypothetical protein
MSISPSQGSSIFLLSAVHKQPFKTTTQHFSSPRCNIL